MFKIVPFDQLYFCISCEKIIEFVPSCQGPSWDVERIPQELWIYFSRCTHKNELSCACYVPTWLEKLHYFWISIAGHLWNSVSVCACACVCLLNGSSIQQEILWFEISSWGTLGSTRVPCKPRWTASPSRSTWLSEVRTDTTAEDRRSIPVINVYMWLVVPRW